MFGFAREGMPRERVRNPTIFQLVLDAAEKNISETSFHVENTLKRCRQENWERTYCMSRPNIVASEMAGGFVIFDGFRPNGKMLLLLKRQGDPCHPRTHSRLHLISLYSSYSENFHVRERHLVSKRLAYIGRQTH